jgi:GAF domain-containing protein
MTALADEQAALRRVATLVAEGNEDLFSAVAREVADLLDVRGVIVDRFETDGSQVTVGSAYDPELAGAEAFLGVGAWVPLAPGKLAAAIQETRRAARVEDYSKVDATTGAAARAAGIGSGCAAPIFVDGELWGQMCVFSEVGTVLPADTEQRLGDFVQLVATAISNHDARAHLRTLADEQAALRRVATLVARESSSEEVFRTVIEEAWRVLDAEAVGLLRFEHGGTAATLVAQSETPWAPPPLGTRFTLDGENVVTQVFHTGKTVRVDDWSGSTGAVAAMATVLGVACAVASPIVVEGRLWGTIIAATSHAEPLADGTESRLNQFTELVVTAIANTEARGELSQLAEQQAALRRIAVLVAQQPSPLEVFTAVTEAVGPLLGADLAAMHVFRGNDVATVIASWSEAGPTLPPGTELPLDGRTAVAQIFNTGAAARVDGYAGVEGETADVARELRLRTAVGAPILVEGKLWGALMAATRGEEPLPEDAEVRIAAFTELVATAVSNAQAREELHGLADEQSALRRVATLVAVEATQHEIFTAVAEGVAGALGEELRLVRYEGDFAVVVAGSEGPHSDVLPVGTRLPVGGNNALSHVFRTGEPIRIDNYPETTSGPIAEAVRASLRSIVATPVVVEGRTWGAMIVGTFGDADPVPPGTEARLGQFAELMATSVANTEARAEIERLAEQEATLRRIATLVASGAEPEQVFAAVAKATAAAFGAIAIIIRFEHDPPASLVVGRSTEIGIEIGTRWPFEEGRAITEVYRTGRSARLSAFDWASESGPFAEAALLAGVNSHVSSPILVEGSLWGAITLSASEELPADTEQRLEKFAELVTTAIANASARVSLRMAADEQGALRRVATLVAASAAPSDVFDAVTEEIGLVLGADASLLCRADRDGTAVVVGSWGDNTPPLGTRIPRGGTNLTTIVLDTGRPSRIESYDDATGESSEIARSQGLRSAVGAPIVVEGLLWGLVVAGNTSDERLPPDAEGRLASFAELVATAISNAEARDSEARLGAEQAALQHVATLVARGVPPAELFSAVCTEIAQVFGGAEPALLASLIRFDPGPECVLVAASRPYELEPVGSRWDPKELYVSTRVLRTGGSARLDEAELDEASGPDADILRRRGFLCQVGSPVVVDGRLWGAMTLNSSETLPPDTDERLERFTELLATAIANATARAALIESRARIVAAGDEARRRIERNLHDGTQQRLIALGLDIAALRASVSEEQGDLDANLERLEGEVDEVLGEVRELSRGLHPGLLSRQGLGPSLRALARRTPLPVSLEVDLPERPTEPVETATYFVVSEALTNAVKYAQASYATVSISVDDSHLRASISDDGVGGAEPEAGAGSGLIGLLDRVNALGGRLELESPPGRGTTISIELPLAQ